MKIDYIGLLVIAIKAALEAGDEVLKIYNTNAFNVQIKSDNSPLTKADIASNEIIKKHLVKTRYPILTEEETSVEYSIRKEWDTFWMVDPLDGTKEFIKKNGEFTVNIALIENRKPVMGIIYAPVTDELYFSDKVVKANKINNALRTIKLGEIKLDSILSKAIKLPIMEKNREYIIVGSRSHMSDKTVEFINKYKDEHPSLQVVSKGSSLKLCLVAEGKADVYPRFGPTMEWDIAAGHAIILGSGGNILTAKDRTELIYNKEDLHSPWFVAYSKNK